MSDLVSVESYTDHLGIERKLNSGPSSLNKLLLFRLWPKEYNKSDRTLWFDINRRDLFDHEDWIFDAGTTGSTASCIFSGALRAARDLSGHTDEKLSPGCFQIQSNVNNSLRSDFSDLVSISSSIGTLPFSQFGLSGYSLSELPSNWTVVSLNYRFDKVYRCDSFEDIISAMVAGWIPIFNYRIGPCFEKFDEHGVACHDYGLTNHCGYADGIKKLPDGRWVLDVVNCFGYKWGPFKNGRCYLDEHHLFPDDNKCPDVVVGFVNPINVDSQNIIPKVI